MVKQLRIGRPHIAVTGFDQTQAKIHVVEANRQFTFVQTTDLYIQCFFDQQARPRHGGKGLHQRRPIAKTRLTLR